MGCSASRLDTARGKSSMGASCRGRPRPWRALFSQKSSLRKAGGLIARDRGAGGFHRSRERVSLRRQSRAAPRRVPWGKELWRNRSRRRADGSPCCGFDPVVPRLPRCSKSLRPLSSLHVRPGVSASATGTNSSAPMSQLALGGARVTLEVASLLRAPRPKSTAA